MPGTESEGEVILVNHNQLQDTLKTSQNIKRPVFIHGTFGIGKSQIVEEMAEEQGKQSERKFRHWNEMSEEERRDAYHNPENYYLFFDIRLAQEEPSNIKGIPDVDEEIDATIWQGNLWTKVICQQGIKGTVFLDECNLASPQVQSAFYQLILKREIAGDSLAQGIDVVSAGNRAGKDRANVYEMSAPLRNRFLHVELEIPSGGEDGNWTQWASQNGIHEYVISYIGSPAGQNDLYKFSEEYHQSHAIPTPRSWEFASDILKELENQKGEIEPKDIQQQVAVAVGQGVAGKFAEFIKLRDKVNFKKYLKEPEKAEELSNHTTSIQRSVITGLASEYREDTDKIDQLLEISIYVPPEMGTLMLYHMMNYHPQHFKNEAYNVDCIGDVADKYADLLRDELKQSVA